MILKIKPSQKLFAFLLFALLFDSIHTQSSNNNGNNNGNGGFNNTPPLNTSDIYNSSAHLVNDTKNPLWNSPPYFYNGTTYFDGERTWPCVRLNNGSNGTNCSQFYGGAVFKGYYNPKTIKCQGALLQSYGFTGYIMANETKFDMCPNIEFSCCSPTDMFQAYQTYAHDGIQHNLINRVNYFNNSYTEYMNALNDADSLIAIIGNKVKVTNNCKVLANAIEPFLIGEVTGFMVTVIRDYFHYHSKNFESFYCTLCDGELHPFFDLTRQKIVYSHRHCKDVVENTLPFLLYFHNHFVKFNNLIVDFMASCDMHGEYTKIPIDESLFKLQIDHELHTNLLRCKKERDTKHWYKACLFICRHYSMTTLDNFFLPNIRKIASIASFIRNSLQILQNQALAEAALDDDDVVKHKARNARMLETAHYKANNDNKETKRNLQQSPHSESYNFLILRTLGLDNLETLMIPNALNAKIDLGQLNAVFKHDGITVENITEIMSFAKKTYEKTFDLYLDTLKFNQTGLSVHIGGLAAGAHLLTLGLTYLAIIFLSLMSI